MSNGDRRGAESAAASVVAAAVALVAVVLTLIVADIGTLLRIRWQTAAAADAGALAAAPLTFVPGGREPSDEAASFVGRNGATMLACSCSIDRTWRLRVVTVVAGATADTLLAGDVSIAVSSSAEFDPVALFADHG